MKQAKKCPTCGAKMVVYPHSLNRTLASALWKAWGISNEGKLAFLVSGASETFTFSERCNFQKLRYWGFVDHGPGGKGRIQATWKLTTDGIAFLHNMVFVPRTVWTFHGEIVETPESFGVKSISMRDIDPDWVIPERKDYARASRPARDENQPSLL